MLGWTGLGWAGPGPDTRPLKRTDSKAAPPTRPLHAHGRLPGLAQPATRSARAGLQSAEVRPYLLVIPAATPSISPQVAGAIPPALRSTPRDGHSRLLAHSPSGRQLASGERAGREGGRAGPERHLLFPGSGPRRGGARRRKQPDRPRHPPASCRARSRAIGTRPAWPDPLRTRSSWSPPSLGSLALERSRAVPLPRAQRLWLGSAQLRDLC